MTIAEYIYDGLGQRIGWHYDVNASGSGPDASDPWFWFLHDDRWRIVATYRVSGGSGSGAASFQHSSATTDANPKERFVFHAAGLDGSGGSSYLDSLVLTQRDLNTTWGSAADSDAEAWHYPLTNWRNDTVRVEARYGGLLAGYRYSVYGDRTDLPAADFNNDGFVDFFDFDDFIACYEGEGCPSGTTADWNADGFVDTFDSDSFIACYEGDIAKGGTLRGLYAGYQADPVLAFNDTTTNVEHDTYHVRHRVYSTDLGRWTRRDPLGYVDEGTLYCYVQASSMTFIDPFGLEPDDEIKKNRDEEQKFWDGQYSCKKYLDEHLDFWLEWLGAKEIDSKGKRNAVSQACRDRLKCIIRAIGYVESRHGCGTGNHPERDPMQCGNPADSCTKGLTGVTSEGGPTREGKLPGVKTFDDIPTRLQKPQKDDGTAKVPSRFSDSKYKIPSKGHQDPLWTPEDSCFWGVLWYIYRTNQRDGLSKPNGAWNMRDCSWEHLLSGAGNYNGKDPPGYRKKVEDAMKTIGCKKD
jgi:RHS repeat-associated protein